MQSMIKPAMGLQRKKVASDMPIEGFKSSLSRLLRALMPITTAKIERMIRNGSQNTNAKLAIIAITIKTLAAECIISLLYEILI